MYAISFNIIVTLRHINNYHLYYIDEKTEGYSI